MFQLNEIEKAFAVVTADAIASARFAVVTADAIASASVVEPTKGKNMGFCGLAMSEPVLDGMRKKRQGVKHRHTKNEEGNYMCKYCDFTTAKESTVSEHITRKHAEEAGRQVNPFECVHCLDRFCSKTAMLHHISNHHVIVMHSCPKDGCTYQGKSQAAICTHYVRKHMDLAANSRVLSSTETMCGCCDKVMKPATMVYHLARCSSESPFYVPPQIMPMELDYPSDDM
jgi:hypothetical protein